MFFTRLPHLVNVQTETTGQDSAGGNTNTYTTSATDVPVLISQSQGGREQRFDQLPNAKSWTVTGTSSALNNQSARIYVVSGPGEGYYLRVVSVAATGPVGGIDRYYRLKCELLEAG